MYLDHRPSRVIIERVSPEIDAGRFPAKRVVGDTVRVVAHVFGDGHDLLSVVLLDAHEQAQAWNRSAMTALGNDEWSASFVVSDLGTHLYTVRAHIDRFATWRRDTLKKIAADQDIRVELQMGASLLGETVKQFTGSHSARIAEASKALAQSKEYLEVLEDEALWDLLSERLDEDSVVTYQHELRVTADPALATFGAWYEMFPRSAAGDARRHGTFKDVVKQLPRITEMGFDVLYLPPVHPVGSSFRKGKNGSLAPKPSDPGSPWAIGAADGGHKAIHPQLGTIEDFDSLVEEAGHHNLAVAMDIAFQCSPEHPYVNEHSEWFKHRPDGTIQYAENPPKKYQDIYPLDFECKEWFALWEELKSVFDYWISHGVRVFRVDNPHTKSLAFWEWVIGQIKNEHPDVLFLAEAFTRPKIMYRLAKLGFSESYTYFTWRNAKRDIEDYCNHLMNTEVSEFFRPNFWPNTPDILHEYLQAGGPPAFAARLVLASTLSGNYGIYGPAFELMENQPVARGSEEYLDSEKYEIRSWDTERTERNLTSMITAINSIRRSNPALQSNRGLVFHPTDNPEIIAYSKSDPDTGNTMLMAVNIDPHHRQSGWVNLDLLELGLAADVSFTVEDLLNGQSYIWEGARNFLELDPALFQAHVFRVNSQTQTEVDFTDYA